jgi:hypothetical protein
MTSPGRLEKLVPYLAFVVMVGVAAFAWKGLSAYRMEIQAQNAKAEARAKEWREKAARQEAAEAAAYSREVTAYLLDHCSRWQSDRNSRYLVGIHPRITAWLQQQMDGGASKRRTDRCRPYPGEAASIATEMSVAKTPIVVFDEKKPNEVVSSQ